MCSSTKLNGRQSPRWSASVQSVPSTTNTYYEPSLISKAKEHWSKTCTPLLHTGIALHPYLRLLLGFVLRVKEKRHVSHEWGCQFRKVQLWYFVGLELFLKFHCGKVLLKGLAQREGTTYNFRFVLEERRYIREAKDWRHFYYMKFKVESNSAET